MRTFVRRAAGAAILLAAGAAQADDGATIGSTLALTGDLGAYGVVMEKGAKLAVDQVNAQGGILDGKLEHVGSDTKTTPQAGVDAANKLVDLHDVDGIVGAMSSGVTLSIAESVTIPQRIPQISPSSTTPKLTTLDDKGYVFRTTPSDSLQGVVMGNLAYERGYREVAILYVNNAYGEGLARELTQQFEKRGGTVTASLPYEKGKASYRGELANASEKDADALALIGYPENGITILRQALRQGHFSNFIFPDAMKAPEVAEQIGAKHLAGAIGTVPASKKGEGAKQFETAYEDAYGRMPPKPFIDKTYDAAFLLALAIEKAGSTKGPAVRDALHAVANPPGTKILPGQWKKARTTLADGGKINYEGAGGSHDFDKNGDVSGLIEHWTFTEDGKLKTVDRIRPEL